MKQHLLAAVVCAMFLSGCSAQMQTDSMPETERMAETNSVAMQTESTETAASLAETTAEATPPPVTEPYVSQAPYHFATPEEAEAITDAMLVEISESEWTSRDFVPDYAPPAEGEEEATDDAEDPSLEAFRIRCNQFLCKRACIVWRTAFETDTEWVYEYYYIERSYGDFGVNDTVYLKHGINQHEKATGKSREDVQVIRYYEIPDTAHPYPDI